MATTTQQRPTSPNPQTACRLLGMPPEIRNMIYSQVFSTKSLDFTTYSCTQLHASLLFTCKQIFAEGYDAYFQQLHRVKEHAARIAREAQANKASWYKTCLDASRAGQWYPITSAEVKELGRFQQEKDGEAARARELVMKESNKMFKIRGMLVKKAIGQDEANMWYQETCEEWEERHKTKPEIKKGWRCAVM